MLNSLLVFLLAAAPAQSSDPCPTVPPYGYRIEVGYGEARKKAAALALARDDAYQRLLTKACSGVGEVRCASLQRHIHPWEDGRFERKSRSACAAVAIEADALMSWERDLARLSEHLQTLADTIAERTGGSLALDTPRWPSGCVAGDVGPNLASELRNRLARHEGIQLFPQGALDQPTVRITLAPGREALTVSADLHDFEAMSHAPLPGFTVPVDLFDIPSDEVGACRGLGAIGLDGIDRVGADDLRLSIEVPTLDGNLCEGQVMEPTVRVSAPARVKVWSVARDGSAYLVWPPPGESGRVEDSLSLGQQYVVLPPEHMGDELMVAAAVPADGTFGSIDAQTGFCRVDGSFTVASVPTSAAVATATYHVVRGGEDGCPPAESQRAELLSMLQSAPVCR